MTIRQGMALLLFVISFTASAEEVTYLVSSPYIEQDVVYGAAVTESDKLEVYGVVKLGTDTESNFAGVWTRLGKIQAVDQQGNMYLFDVIRVLNSSQAFDFVHNIN